MTTQIDAALAVSPGGRSPVQGSGDMADLIREYPWQNTPLGSISQWSETLLASVNAMLLSPFSFAIFWGKDHLVLYNDHYREFLGEKHPGALGSRGADVWKEAWSTIGEPIRTAFEEGGSTGARNAFIPILIDGHLEDRWWTYGFNPIFENGNIAGVANPGADDTATVIAEQELRKSQEALHLTMESAALGICMVRRQIASEISVASDLGLRKCIRPVCGASAPGHNGVRASLVYKVGRTPEGFSFPHRLGQRRLRPFTHTSICLANLRGKLYSSSSEGWKSVES